MKKDEISNLIKELIEKINVPVSSISINEEEGLLGKGGITWFSVEVKEPHLFWNRGGEALSALSHLVRRIVETKTPEEMRGGASSMAEGILIDVNNFQKKRIENVRAVAHMMAERARYFKSSIEVEPMSAFERRIVHEFLSTAPDVKTESQGVGPSRRVVIKYIGDI